MRKLYFPLAILFAGLVLSCKKEVQAPIKSTGDANSKITDWMEMQKQNKKDWPILAANIDLLKSNLDFSKMRIEQSEEEEEIVIIPVKDAFKQQKKLAKNAIPNLVLIQDKAGNFRKGNLVLYYPDEEKIDKVPNNTFYHILNTAEPECNGKFSFLTLSGGRLYELEYKDKALRSVANVKKGQNARTSTYCIDWYLITTYYDVNGVELYTTEDYVGQTCSDCDPLNGCGGGGGNISSPPDGEDPNDEYAVRRLVRWTVAPAPPGAPSGEILSEETLKGKRVSSEPQGGHFTGINHFWSICNFCTIDHPYDVWSESINDGQASGQNASMYISGNLQYNGVGYIMSNTKGWTFGGVW